MGEGGGGLGGGLWGVDHKILRGNMRRINRCQQRIWGGGGCGKLTTNQLPMREKGTVRISQSPIKGSGKFLSWLIQNPPKPTTPPPKRQWLVPCGSAFLCMTLISVVIDGRKTFVIVNVLRRLKISVYVLRRPNVNIFRYMFCFGDTWLIRILSTRHTVINIFHASIWKTLNKMMDHF